MALNNITTLGPGSYSEASNKGNCTLLTYNNNHSDCSSKVTVAFLLKTSVYFITTHAEASITSSIQVPQTSIKPSMHSLVRDLSQKTSTKK